jgi:hypothetical protein
VVVQSHVDSSNITIYEEERVATFTTGAGLDYIPTTNIKGSYPYDGQFDFYPNQIPQGQKAYILLERGQPDLFAIDSKKKLVVRFKKHCGQVTEVPLAYKGLEEKIEFSLPQGVFNSGDIYRMQVVQINTIAGATPTGSASGSANKISSSNCGPELLSANEKILYSAYFRVSQYNTFGAKIDAWNASKTVSVLDDRTIRAMATMEPFDTKELAQIDLRADFTGNSWYTSIHDLIYNDLPTSLHPAQGPSITLNRPQEPWGVIPFKAINLSAEGGQVPTITKQHWIDGFANGGSVSIRMDYKVHKTFNDDYTNFQTGIKSYVYGKIQSGTANYTCHNYCDCASAMLPDNMLPIICKEDYGVYNPTPFPEAPSGQYKVVIRVPFPGTNQWAAEKTITIQK